MKHIFLGILIVLAAVEVAGAQEIQQMEMQNGAADSVKVERAPLADSTLVGTSIFQLLGRTSDNGGTVILDQPRTTSQMYGKYVRTNGERKRNGYRIRLFFDNKQTARMESEKLEIEFQEQFPLIPVYRSYTAPFFKVVAGDFRTKSDAIRELNKILPFYPQAIVVKESIYYPAI